jgi:hypothetical protein
VEYELDTLLSDSVMRDLAAGLDRAAPFLNAARALLFDLFDAPDNTAPSPQVRYLLGRYLTPRLIVAKAASEWSGPTGADNGPPDRASFQDVWPESDHLGDALIWALKQRLAGVADGSRADAVIAAGTDEDSLVEALELVAVEHVRGLVPDPAFRLQTLISATTLGRDERLHEALSRISSANVAAWVPFWKTIGTALGPLHWPDAGSYRLAALWHAGTATVARGALDDYRADPGQLTLSQPTGWLLKLTVLGIVSELSPYRSGS